MARGGNKKTGGGKRRKSDGDGDDIQEKRKGSSFKSFLKKRAPIYLGLVALFVVFAVPELTKAGLQDSLPELAAGDQKIVDILMGYNGPNETGLTLAEAISMKISEQYPDERIFNDKRTSVELTVTNIATDLYMVDFVFKSHKGEIVYNWNVDVESQGITTDNPESQYVIDLVDFYD